MAGTCLVTLAFRFDGQPAIHRGHMTHSNGVTGLAPKPPVQKLTLVVTFPYTMSRAMRLVNPTTYSPPTSRSVGLPE